MGGGNDDVTNHELQLLLQNDYGDEDTNTSELKRIYIAYDSQTCKCQAHTRMK